jgi:3-hydroxyisobutyrate dehydrogenase
MLPNSAIVTDVLFGTGGLAARMGQGSLLVDMTSGLPETTRTLATRLADLGVAMIDAPVSGGVARARTGELSIMAGGEAGQLDAATPALECLGRVTRTGPVGTGHAMKALNNLVSAGGFLIGIEALVIGMKAGIDPDTMVGILNEATGMNNSTKQKFRQFVLSRSFNSGFALDLMAKDLTIAMSLAHDSKAVAPFAALCREIWAAASTTLGGNTDHTELARFVEGLSAVELRSGDERAAS